MTIAQFVTIASAALTYLASVLPSGTSLNVVNFLISILGFLSTGSFTLKPGAHPMSATMKHPDLAKLLAGVPKDLHDKIAVEKWAQSLPPKP